MKTMTIRLDDRQANLLDAVIRIDHQSAVQVIREALDQYIDRRFEDPDFQERIRQAARNAADLAAQMLEERRKD